MPEIQKLLVCNRGEIAIRVFRSAVEFGARTVAVYSHEDRFSLHRFKADEAYQVGKEGNPVGSYLDIDEVVRIAKKSGADAVHPGYGFLSEKMQLCERLEQEGITFVGPTSEALRIAGDKRRTKELAQSVDVPTVPGALLGGSVSALDQAEMIGYPIIVKAAFGGGGRGMRIVRRPEDLEASINEASQEAGAAFGAPEVYLERCISRPKHIEVQLMGDGLGNVIHLYERDCSVQRRHQKLVEYAPSIALSAEQKKRLYEYALKLAGALKLRSLATAEFLVDESGEIYFIEVNPRIQVEHTVTEEITGIDLVKSQLEIASGRSLGDLGLAAGAPEPNGVAIQCRITTEDPTADFMPDYGKIVAYRSASGFGIRLDAGSAYTGGSVTPFYDSMLVKVTAHGRTMLESSRRLSRSLREFRIRGVKTNVQFLDKLLQHSVFLSGDTRTTFLEEHPEVFELPRRLDRANRILRFLSETVVNGHELMPGLVRPSGIGTIRVPMVSEERQAPTLEELPGWRTRLNQLGKKAFLRAVREEKTVLTTDTTFRDAHQSLLATRMRTFDMLKVAEPLARTAPEIFSLEMWGGATFDVCLRFLREDPWKRVERLREKVPNILFQMLIRGANVVGYKSYPDNVVRRFAKEAHDAGIDIFRIFDCFNQIEQMRPAIEAVQEAGAIAEVSICYTGDVLSEQQRKQSGQGAKFDLDYYFARAEECVAAGADIIAIKDMAGLLRAPSAKLLIGELRRRVDVPIHLHTHDTAGGQIGTYLAASEAGVDIVDCAFSAMSGVTSQPSLEGFVAALENSERATGMTVERLAPFSSYWDAIRRMYAPFESDLKTATGEVYINEIPGGQYSNFRPQAASVGLADRWDELKQAYADVNKLFGGIVKVTPSSKVVGDLALFLVANNLTADQFADRADTLDPPASVLEFFRGEIGVPHGGIPAALQRKVLRGEKPLDSRPGDSLPDADFEDARAEASELLGREASIRDALSLLLYPRVFKDYAEARNKFSDVSLLPSMSFFYGLAEGEEIYVDIEKGKRLFIQLVAVSEPGDSGERTVFYELNGQPRNIAVRDAAISSSHAENETADSANAGHVGAPLAGALVEMSVAEGDRVQAHQPLFTIEAMKMQTIVHSPSEGVVKRVLLAEGARVSAGDLVVELE
ncbi:MAG: pyruvate carboxylase [Bdellovibrionales bacterium]|nr:pyruvate carboxylase [Bdellovibrionales bacterium]